MFFNRYNKRIADLEYYVNVQDGRIRVLMSRITSINNTIQSIMVAQDLMGQRVQSIIEVMDSVDVEEQSEDNQTHQAYINWCQAIDVEPVGDE